MEGTWSLYLEATGIAARRCSIDLGAHFFAHLALRAASLSLCLSRTACSKSTAPTKKQPWLKWFELETLVLKDIRILSNALHLTEWDTLVHLIRSSLSYYGRMALIQTDRIQWTHYICWRVVSAGVRGCFASACATTCPQLTARGCLWLAWRAGELRWEEVLEELLEEVGRWLWLHLN